MYIRFSRASLQDALGTVINATGRPGYLPIISYILVKATDRVTLAATDLEIGMQVTIDAGIVESGSCTIPARKTMQIIKALPPVASTIEFKSDGDRSTISWGSGTFRLPSLYAGEFPTLPNIPPDTIRIDTQQLAHIFNRVAFAADSDSDTIYNAVCLELAGDNITAVATNRRMLALATNINVASALGEPSENTTIALIPSRVGNLLKHLTDDVLDVGFTENQIVINAGDIRLTARQYEGAFPEYRSLFSQFPRITIKVDTQQMLDTVRRVSLTADPKTMMVVMDIADNIMKLSAQTYEGAEAYEELALLEAEGSIRIAFHAPFIINILKNADSPEMTWQFAGPLDPAIARPDDQAIYLVMPMRMDDDLTGGEE